MGDPGPSNWAHHLACVLPTPTQQLVPHSLAHPRTSTPGTHILQSWVWTQPQGGARCVAVGGRVPPTCRVGWRQAPPAKGVLSVVLTTGEAMERERGPATSASALRACLWEAPPGHRGAQMGQG